MSKASLPPHFVEVSLAACLLAGGAVALMQTLASAPATKAAPVVVDASAGEDELEPEDLPKDDTEVERHGEQVVALEGLSHEVTVNNSCFSDEKLAELLQRFQRDVQPFEESGQRIGVYIHNLTTDVTVSYNADELFYTASSIKGPYCLAVYERLVDPGIVSAADIAGLTEQTIVESDNDTYEELSLRCGREAFVDWAVSCGGLEKDSDSYRELIANRHGHLTARQLGAMWEHGFAYLEADSAGAQELRGYLQGRTESPLRDASPDGSVTYAKAGWYPEDLGPEYYATADAGIMTYKGYDYVIVVMTDMPADLDRLSQLMPGVISARRVTR